MNCKKEPFSNRPQADTGAYSVRPLNREQLLSVYRDIAPAHFPEEELKPLSAIESLLDTKSYLGLGLYRTQDDSLLGYALFLTVSGLDVILLDYYAILEDYRDLGVGSIFIQEMRRHFDQFHGILIETEDPDCAATEEEHLLRVRRNAFYYKNGAHRTDISCALFGVPFTILFLETTSCVSQKVPNCCVLSEVSKSRSGSSLSGSVENPLSLRLKLDTIYRFMLPEESYAANVVWR